MAARQHLGGTVRLRPPEQTWDLIEPLFAGAGITRVADVTWLDDLGIPTWQAIRPLGLSLSVSQGKGLTPLLAKVSAAMESIESHHAEHERLPRRRLRLREAMPELSYDPYRLPLAEGSLLHDGLSLEWVSAVGIASGAATIVPADMVSQDFVAREPRSPIFHRSSSGLASGNSAAEATVHALCELIERDCVARAPERGPVKTFGRVAPEYRAAAGLLRDIRGRGARVVLSDVTNEMGVPTFYAELWSPTYPVPGSGSGCHLSTEVALCRAITEAAQTRLIAISGARDDLGAQLMEDVSAHQFVDDLLPDIEAEVPYEPFTEEEHPSFADDIAVLAERITRHTGFSPLLVDLTPPGYPVAIVKVIAPGLRSLK